MGPVLIVVVYELCVRANNDWVIEEFAGGSNGRVIASVIVPLWDPSAAAEEVRRNANRGCRAVRFSEIPAWLGLPSLHSGEWDVFDNICFETDYPHPDSNWPNSRRAAWKQTASLTPDERDKVLRRNGMRLLGIESQGHATG